MANGQKTARVKNGNGKKNGNVVKREAFNLAISGEELAGKGFEQMGTKDLALPFLKYNLVGIKVNPSLLTRPISLFISLLFNNNFLLRLGS